MVNPTNELLYRSENESFTATHINVNEFQNHKDEGKKTVIKECIL